MSADIMDTTMQENISASILHLNEFDTIISFTHESHINTTVQISEVEFYLESQEQNVAFVAAKLFPDDSLNTTIHMTPHIYDPSFSNSSYFPDNIPILYSNPYSQTSNEALHFTDCTDLKSKRIDGLLYVPTPLSLFTYLSSDTSWSLGSNLSTKIPLDACVSIKIVVQHSNDSNQTIEISDIYTSNCVAIPSRTYVRPPFNIIGELAPFNDNSVDLDVNMSLVATENVPKTTGWISDRKSWPTNLSQSLDAFSTGMKSLHFYQIQRHDTAQVMITKPTSVSLPISNLLSLDHTTLLGYRLTIQNPFIPFQLQFGETDFYNISQGDNLNYFYPLPRTATNRVQFLHQNSIPLFFDNTTNIHCNDTSMMTIANLDDIDSLLSNFRIIHKSMRTVEGVQIEHDGSSTFEIQTTVLDDSQWPFAHNSYVGLEFNLSQAAKNLAFELRISVESFQDGKVYDLDGFGLQSTLDAFQDLVQEEDYIKFASNYSTHTKMNELSNRELIYLIVPPWKSIKPLSTIQIPLPDLLVGYNYTLSIRAINCWLHCTTNDLHTLAHWQDVAQIRLDSTTLHADAPLLPRIQSATSTSMEIEYSLDGACYGGLAYGVLVYMRNLRAYNGTQEHMWMDSVSPVFVPLQKTVYNALSHPTCLIDEMRGGNVYVLGTASTKNSGSDIGQIYNEPVLVESQNSLYSLYLPTCNEPYSTMISHLDASLPVHIGLRTVCAFQRDLFYATASAQSVMDATVSSGFIPADTVLSVSRSITTLIGSTLEATSASPPQNMSVCATSNENNLSCVPFNSTMTLEPSSNSTQNELMISWMEPADTGGQDILCYDIEVAFDGMITSNCSTLQQETGYDARRGSKGVFTTCSQQSPRCPYHNLYSLFDDDLIPSSPNPMNISTDCEFLWDSLYDTIQPPMDQEMACDSLDEYEPFNSLQQTMFDINNCMCGSIPQTHVCDTVQCNNEQLNTGSWSNPIDPENSESSVRSWIKISCISPDSDDTYISLADWNGQTDSETLNTQIRIDSSSSTLEACKQHTTQTSYSPICSSSTNSDTTENLNLDVSQSPFMLDHGIYWYEQACRVLTSSIASDSMKHINTNTTQFEQLWAPYLDIRNPSELIHTGWTINQDETNQQTPILNATSIHFNLSSHATYRFRVRPITSRVRYKLSDPSDEPVPLNISMTEYSDWFNSSIRSSDPVTPPTALSAYQIEHAFLARSTPETNAIVMVPASVAAAPQLSFEARTSSSMLVVAEPSSETGGCQLVQARIWRQECICLSRRFDGEYQCGGNECQTENFADDSIQPWTLSSSDVLWNSELWGATQLLWKAQRNSQGQVKTTFCVYDDYADCALSWKLDTQEISSVSLNDYDLQEATPYRYIFEVETFAGNSSTFKSKLTKPVPASAPIDLQSVATWTTPVQLGIRWDAPLNDGGLYITGYAIEKRESFNSSGTATGLPNLNIGQWEQVAIVPIPFGSSLPGTVHSYNLTGLTPETTLEIRIAALTGIDNGLRGAVSVVLDAETAPPVPCFLNCSEFDVCHSWNGTCLCPAGFTGKGCEQYDGAVFLLELSSDVDHPDAYLQDALEYFLEVDANRLLLIKIEAVVGYEYHMVIRDNLEDTESIDDIIERLDTLIYNKTYTMQSIGIVQVSHALNTERSNLTFTTLASYALPNCSQYTTCGSCLSSRACGWCRLSLTCHTGYALRPAASAAFCALSNTWYHHESTSNNACPQPCYTLSGPQNGDDFGCSACSQRSDCFYCISSKRCEHNLELTFGQNHTNKICPAAYHVYDEDQCPTKRCHKSSIISASACLQDPACGWCSRTQSGTSSFCGAGDAYGMYGTDKCTNGRYFYMSTTQPSCTVDLTSPSPCKTCSSITSNGIPQCGWCEASHQCGSATKYGGTPVIGDCSNQTTRFENGIDAPLPNIYSAVTDIERYTSVSLSIDNSMSQTNTSNINANDNPQEMNADNNTLAVYKPSTNMWIPATEANKCPVRPLTPAEQCDMQTSCSSCLAYRVDLTYVNHTKLAQKVSGIPHCGWCSSTSSSSSSPSGADLNSRGQCELVTADATTSCSSPLGLNDLYCAAERCDRRTSQTFTAKNATIRYGSAGLVCAATTDLVIDQLKDPNHPAWRFYAFDGSSRKLYNKFVGTGLHRYSHQTHSQQFTVSNNRSVEFLSESKFGQPTKDIILEKPHHRRKLQKPSRIYSLSAADIVQMSCDSSFKSDKIFRNNSKSTTPVANAYLPNMACEWVITPLQNGNGDGNSARNSLVNIQVHNLDLGLGDYLFITSGDSISAEDALRQLQQGQVPDVMVGYMGIWKGTKKGIAAPFKPSITMDHSNSDTTNKVSSSSIISDSGVKFYSRSYNSAISWSSHKYFEVSDQHISHTSESGYVRIVFVSQSGGGGGFEMSYTSGQPQVFDVYFVAAVVITGTSGFIFLACAIHRFVIVPRRRRNRAPTDTAEQDMPLDLDGDVGLQDLEEEAARRGRSARVEIVKKFPAFYFEKALLEQTPLRTCNPQDLVCAISLQEYDDGDVVRLLPCGHHFLQNSIDQWLKLRKLCPMCKRDVHIMWEEFNRMLESGEFQDKFKFGPDVKQVLQGSSSNRSLGSFEETNSSSANVLENDAQHTAVAAVSETSLDTTIAMMTQSTDGNNESLSNTQSHESATTNTERSVTDTSRQAIEANYISNIRRLSDRSNADYSSEFTGISPLATRIPNPYLQETQQRSGVNRGNGHLIDNNRLSDWNQSTRTNPIHDSTEHATSRTSTRSVLHPRVMNSVVTRVEQVPRRSSHNFRSLFRRERNNSNPTAQPTPFAHTNPLWSSEPTGFGDTIGQDRPVLATSRINVQEASRQPFMHNNPLRMQHGTNARTTSTASGSRRRRRIVQRTSSREEPSNSAVSQRQTRPFAMQNPLFGS